MAARREPARQREVAPSAALHLEDVRYIDQRGEIRQGHLRVDEGEGEGEAAGAGVELVERIPERAFRLQCDGRLVVRAFAIAHHHIYSALARGMPAPRRAPRSFVEILELVWWNLDRALDLDMVTACAAAAGIEALKCGTTFIIDHHSSPNAVEGSLHAIAAALDRVGVGHLLCCELSDRDGSERLAAGFAETERYLRGHDGLVGLHASFTVSDDTLDRAVDLARRTNSGIHVHVAEAAADEENCVAWHGCRVVERLARRGALELPKTLLAHCLHLDDAERGCVRDSKAWVVQNPESNRHNAVGTVTAQGIGDRILLGTDGMHSDALQSLRAAYLDGQVTGGLAPGDAHRRLRRAHDYLAANGVRGAGANDLVVLDYAPPTPIDAANWPAHAVYGLSRADVRHVIRQGRLLVEDRVVTTVDEEEVLAHARAQARRLWARL